MPTNTASQTRPLTRAPGHTHMTFCNVDCETCSWEMLHRSLRYQRATTILQRTAPKGGR